MSTSENTYSKNNNKNTNAPKSDPKKDGSARNRSEEYESAGYKGPYSSETLKDKIINESIGLNAALVGLRGASAVGKTVVNTIASTTKNAEHDLRYVSKGEEYDRGRQTIHDFNEIAKSVADKAEIIVGKKIERSMLASVFDRDIVFSEKEAEKISKALGKNINEMFFSQDIATYIGGSIKDIDDTHNILFRLGLEKGKVYSADDLKKIIDKKIPAGERSEVLKGLKNLLGKSWNTVYYMRPVFKDNGALNAKKTLERIRTIGVAGFLKSGKARHLYFKSKAIHHMTHRPKMRLTKFAARKYIETLSQTEFGQGLKQIKEAHQAVKYLKKPGKAAAKLAAKPGGAVLKFVGKRAGNVFKKSFSAFRMSVGAPARAKLAQMARELGEKSKAAREVMKTASATKAKAGNLINKRLTGKGMKGRGAKERFNKSLKDVPKKAGKTGKKAAKKTLKKKEKKKFFSSVKDGIKKTAKGIGRLVAKHPIVLIVLVIIVLLFMILALLFSMNNDATTEMTDFTSNDEEVQKLAAQTIIDCYKKQEKQVDALSDIFDNVNITRKNIKNDEIYEQYKPEVQFSETTNSAEILSMTMVYFGGDLGNISEDQLTKYIKQLYWASHVMEITTHEEEITDENGNTSYQINADVVITTYYFDEIFNLKIGNSASAPSIESQTTSGDSGGETQTWDGNDTNSSEDWSAAGSTD